MKIYHQSLSSGRWFELSFPEQMANIGSEIFRTISAKKEITKKIQKLPLKEP